jgi:Lon protease-like protein
MARWYTSVEELPRALPVFPLAGVLLLPRGRLPLNIFEKRYLAMLDDALAGDRLIGMIQPSDPTGSKQASSLYPVGCAGRITQFSETEDGRCLVTLAGIARFKVMEELPLHRGYRRVLADWTEYSGDLKEEGCTVDRGRLVSLLQDYFRKHGLSANWEAIENAPDERLLTSLAMICPFDAGEKQALLEAGCLADRAQIMMTLLEIAIAGHGEDGQPRH